MGTDSPRTTRRMIFAMYFSGSCISPKLFIVLLMTTGIPKVRQYEIAIASCAALEAAYGLLGTIDDHSLNRTSSGAGPYTSSVETWTNALHGYSRANSSIVRAMPTLFCTNHTGSSIERSTWESDATFMMKSHCP